MAKKVSKECCKGVPGSGFVERLGHLISELEDLQAEAYSEVTTDFIIMESPISNLTEILNDLVRLKEKL